MSEAGADATKAQEDEAAPNLVPGKNFETAAEEETKA
jgi:hypothetical protein